MPIYGFRCKKCDHSFQTLVRSGDESACPSCGGVELEQQLSLIASPSKGGNEAPSCATAGAGPSCAACPGAAMLG